MKKKIGVSLKASGGVGKGFARKLPQLKGGSVNKNTTRSGVAKDSRKA